MEVRNMLAMSDADFLAESVRCWQEALARGDMEAFQYWAVHAFCFCSLECGDGAVTFVCSAQLDPHICRWARWGYGSARKAVSDAGLLRLVLSPVWCLVGKPR
jgi:hypothetical protein